MARSFLIQSNLSKKFWLGSLLMVNDLINRLPSQIVKWKSPYGVLNNKKLDYKNLRMFGCFIDLTKVSLIKVKFASRAKKGVFLGFSTGQKGYKVYTLDTKKLLISWDVIFHKTQFPYLMRSVHLDHEIEDIVPLLVVLDTSNDCSSHFEYLEPYSSRSS